MKRFTHPTVTFLLSLTLLFTVGCSKAAKRERFLKEARKNFAAGKYENAEINYTKALRIPPVNPEAVAQLGIIYFQSGRLPQANAYLTEAVKLDPDNLDARVNLGLLNLTVRNLGPALEQANYVLSKQPTNQEAVLLLAECATNAASAKAIASQINSLAQVSGDAASFRLGLATLALRAGDIPQAKQHIAKALQLDPKYAPAQSARAIILLQEHQTKEAGEALKTAADLSPPRSPRRIQYAMFKLQSGETDAARTVLKEIIDQAPDYIPAYTALAQLELGAKRPEEAGKLIDTALLKDNGNYDALLLNGSIKLVKGDTKAAVEAFTRASAVYARSPQVAFQLARAHLLNGETAKAITFLNQALQLQPGNPEAVLLLAELNLQKGDTLPVIASITALLKKQPNIPQAYLMLAAAHAARNDAASALEVYSLMRKAFPKSPEVPYLAAGLLARQGRFDEARRQCDNALQISTNYLPAVELLVDLDLSQRHYADAMARANRLQAALTNTAEPRLLAAKIYIAQTNYAQAEEALLKTIEINPESTKAYLWLAQIQVESGHQKEALERLNTLVARTNDISAYMQIGIIHETLKEYPAARDAYEKLLSFNPRFSPALNNLAYIYADKLNNPAKALPLAELARELLPYNPSAADTLGWVLYRKGDYSRALGLLQDASTKLPDEPEVQYHLGMAGYMVGDEDLARAAFTRALQATNNPPYFGESKSRLATLNLNAGSASVESLQAVLKKNPGDPIALSRLAAAYLNQKNYEKAAETYQSILKAVPGNARPKLKLAELYSGPLKNPTKAMELAKEAHAAMPGDPEIMKTLGRLAFKSGDFAWSASLLQDAARKSPEDLELQYALAWSLYANGNVNAAREALELAVQATNSAPFKTDTSQFLTLLNASTNLSTVKSIQSKIDAALQTDASYVPAIGLSAMVDASEGRTDSATKKFESVLAKYPNFTPAAREIAIIASANPSSDPKAFDLALKARQAYPQDPLVARALGLMSYRRNDSSRAVQYLQEATRANPKDAEALFYLGSAQLQLKSPKDAKSTLQQALALNLPPTLAQEAKRLLSESK